MRVVELTWVQTTHSDHFWKIILMLEYTAQTIPRYLPRFVIWRRGCLFSKVRGQFTGFGQSELTDFTENWLMYDHHCCYGHVHTAAKFGCQFSVNYTSDNCIRQPNWLLKNAGSDNHICWNSTQCEWNWTDQAFKHVLEWWCKKTQERRYVLTPCCQILL